jgi:dTDP-4-dehydrorhamnose 3,5-epimerase-like enzyme
MLDFKVMGDSRGSLVALEEMRQVPFSIKRVYYIFGTSPGQPRGFHAHRALSQVMVCVHGSLTMLMDDGTTRQNIVLDCPNKGLLVPSMVWHEMHNISDDCVMIALASDYYEEVDYIRDYDDFLNALK